MAYVPKPIPTDHVTLPAELLELSERLAENAHEEWASLRMKQGWTYGPARDDSAREHPCLVPYHTLPDEEKDIDRQAVFGVLKATLALGFTFVAPARGNTASARNGADSAALFDRHLESNYTRPGFDMDDSQELPLVLALPQLRGGSQFLQDVIGPEWNIADAAALLHQARHRRFARVAVAAGVAAIVLAVLQLALAQAWPELAHPAAWLEAAAVVASVIAVGVGVWAKANKNWLAWRHRAELLRMLKFRAVLRVELWQGRLEDWKEWVATEVGRLPKLATPADLERWSRDDTTRAEEPLPAAPGASDDERSALVAYFRHKRLLNQADYFDRKGKAAAESWIMRLRHQRESLFFLTIASVLFHFVAEYVSGRYDAAQQIAAAHAWHVAALAGVAMAAILPVLGLGLRAWSGVFEQSRKARTFDAKRRAMLRAAERLRAGATDWPTVLSQLRTDEVFLEMEHREWLRLMLDAEWFL